MGITELIESTKALGTNDGDILAEIIEKLLNAAQANPNGNLSEVVAIVEAALED